MKDSQDKVSTKQKILVCAASLFAEKGYTETSVRELASAVGLKAASIYNHFASKSAILECILEDYAAQTAGAFDDTDILSKLRENPAPEGILACMQLSFPAGKEAYFLKILCVILQEQHRNPIIRRFVADRFILRDERNVKTVINMLKELNILRQDTDPDFWMKMSSSLYYAFASRMMLGIGDSALDFTGEGMADMLKSMFGLMFKICGVESGKGDSL
ncbi:MAG: TetR/AcrR family transcriptional regulator [Firmicutes bacterium]|nr:TetR/AcrR family transcriptional regulator [Bacillota bacterium]